MTQVPRTTIDSFNYNKIYDTFRNEYTKDLHERQVALLKKIVRHNVNGLKIADFPILKEILLAAYEKLNLGIEVFVDPLCDLVRLCGQPFIREKSNEELSNPSFVPCIVSVLACFITTKQLKLQLVTIETLCNFSTGACLPRKETFSAKSLKKDDLRPSSRNYSLQLLYECEIAPLVVAILGSILDFDKISESLVMEASEEGGETNPQFVMRESQSEVQLNRMETLLLPIMGLVREMSSWSENSKVLVSHNLLKYIIQILETVHDLKDDLLPICIEILWNTLDVSKDTLSTSKLAESRSKLIDKYRFSNAMYHLGCVDTIKVLTNLLELFLKKGYRKQDKELRNDCVAVIKLIFTKIENRPLCRDSGLLNLIISYATAAEMNKTTGGDAHIFSSTMDEDFELKQLLWFLLSDLADENIPENLQNLKIISQSYLFQSLLKYLMIDQTESTVIHQWTPFQLHSLQLCALSTLLRIAPQVPDEFIRANGHVVLIQCVEKSSNEEISEIALSVILQICRIASIQSELGSMGSIELILSIFADEDRLVSIRQIAVSILSGLCLNHEENQRRFRRANGIGSLYDHLVYEPTHAVTRKNLVISVVDALWICVIGNRRNEATILQLEGVDKLLQLLENCPSIMHGQVLSVIAELCKNPKAASFFRAWRSELKSKTALQLLLQMWIDEEVRLGVERPPNGILKNFHRPLQSHLCPEPQDSSDCKVNESSLIHPTSPAFARLKEALDAAHEYGDSNPNNTLDKCAKKLDLRVKIYAVFANVGFPVLYDKLDSEEQLALAVAKEYPQFRIGEMWLDLKEELYEEKVRPIYPDVLMIENNLEKSFNICLGIKCIQIKISDQEQKQKSLEEETFFRSIILQKEQELQTLKLYKKSRLPKSSYKSRMEAKAKKAEMLQRSLQMNETLQKNLNE